MCNWRWTIRQRSSTWTLPRRRALFRELFELFPRNMAPKRRTWADGSQTIPRSLVCCDSPCVSFVQPANEGRCIEVVGKREGWRSGEEWRREGRRKGGRVRGKEGWKELIIDKSSLTYFMINHVYRPVIKSIWSNLEKQSKTKNLQSSILTSLTKNI